jgi:hypothetical protein
VNSTQRHSGFVIPENYFTGEVTSADLVIFATAWTSPYKTTTAAWASACRYSSNKNRPVMGQVNLLPYEMSTLSTYQHVIIHEIAHILGMSVQFQGGPGQQSLWNLAAGRPLTRDEMLGSDTVAGKPVTKVCLLVYACVLTCWL